MIHLQDGARVPHVLFLDERDARPVNPNTPEGEIRNMAAFAAGAHASHPGPALRHPDRRLAGALGIASRSWPESSPACRTF